MDEKIDRIVRLLKILGKPYNEIVGIFWINDEVVVDCISVTENGKDFEMGVFTKIEGSDWEAIIPSHLLTEEELDDLCELLENILINS